MDELLHHLEDSNNWGEEVVIQARSLLKSCQRGLELKIL